MAAYATVMRLFPGYHMPPVFMAMQNISIRNLNTAEELLRSSLTINDAEPLAYNELGMVYFHRGQCVNV